MKYYEFASIQEQLKLLRKIIDATKAAIKQKSDRENLIEKKRND